MAEQVIVVPQKFPWTRAMKQQHVAAYLGVTTSRVTQLVTQGRLRAIKASGDVWLNYEDVCEHRTKQAGK